MKNGVVRNWMTGDVISTPPYTRMHDALRLMRREKIRSLPIVDESSLVGVVTLRDLLRADTSTVIKDAWDQYRQVGNEPVSRIMTKGAVTISSEAPVARAARVMMENKFSSIPVVNADGVMVGIITSSDLFRMIIDEVPLLDEPIIVADYMTSEPVVVDPETSLLDIHRLMGVKRIRAIPVVQEKLLVGIVTFTDVVSADPSAFTTRGNQEISNKIQSTPVRYVMTSSPITIRQTSSITEAARLMLHNKIHSLPVMNDKETLVGMITETDLFRLIVNRFL